MQRRSIPRPSPYQWICLAAVRFLFSCLDLISVSGGSDNFKIDALPQSIRLLPTQKQLLGTISGGTSNTVVTMPTPDSSVSCSGAFISPTVNSCEIVTLIMSRGTVGVRSSAVAKVTPPTTDHLLVTFRERICKHRRRFEERPSEHFGSKP
jgi:hypothetical protein